VAPRGFTLIELLVVVAIIGILSSIVLVALGSARSKAKDTRVIGDVRQARTIIESEANVSGTYQAGANNCVTATDTLNTTAGTLCKQIADDASNNGGVLSVKATVAAGSFSAYAVYGRLVSDTSKYFCIDSTGKINALATAATTVACP